MTGKEKILVNVFSNWANLLVMVGLAFVVSPIIVHNLGNENYGIWTLIVSLTGYFTVLDFGVNTAIVRFISLYEARRDQEKANEIYCTSFVFFLGVGVFIIIASGGFGYFFKGIFGIEALSRSYLHVVFLIVGIDLALGLVFSVWLGVLTGLQEYVKINGISMVTTLAKNVVLVALLLSGFELLALAVVQLSSNAVRYILNYLVIRRKYQFLRFQLRKCNLPTFRQVYDYSIYSFIIAVALKLLFYTDSVVISYCISVSVVVFFAIPAMLMDYLQKFIWAMIGVLIPVVSRSEALDEKESNRELYIVGTKYSLAICMPIMFVLFTAGKDFIGLWLGSEYGSKSEMVLKILVAGHVFFFSQMIAHAILKGISKHRVLSFFIIAEAVANLGLSIVLAGRYGLEGVAIGTAGPMAIVNMIAIPVYTCRQVGIKLGAYYRQCFVRMVVLATIMYFLYSAIPFSIARYWHLVAYSAVVALLCGAYAMAFIVEREHRVWLRSYWWVGRGFGWRN